MKRTTSSLIAKLRTMRKARATSTLPHRWHLLSVVLPALVFVPQVQGQSTEGEPRFGTQVLSSGFSPDPQLLELVPGGTDSVSGLPGDCFGYINESQPDVRISFQSGANPLSLFVNSNIDTTLLVSDPEGNWHCSDDSSYLSDANPGVLIDAPLSGYYNLWVGTYAEDADPLYTILAITEQQQEQWASLDLGVEESILAMSLDENGNIDFGDDNGFYTLDDECDDPRFQGPGAAFGSSMSELFHDASDCRSQFEAGRVSLAEAGSMFSDDSLSMFGDSMPSVTTESPTPPALQILSSLWDAISSAPGLNNATTGMEIGSSNEPIVYSGDDDIDFGDNSSVFSDDGECDDPRFEGSGMAGFTDESNTMRDANDCILLYMEGALTYLENGGQDSSIVQSTVVNNSGIDFGDNTSMFADDGECDDPRFEGQGPFALLTEGNIGHDANDCQEAYLAGAITYVGDGAELNLETNTAFNNAVSFAGNSVPVQTQQIADIPSGPRGPIDGANRDDGSIFASGTVYGDSLNAGDRNPALNTFGNPVQTTAAPTNAPSGNINFGDNSSTWANDGECDDPRFEGFGMAAVVFDDDLMKDANDCRSLYDEGSITLK
ncbi:MAG: hypothetical protein GKR91_19605 [Pseudomonadales bacterium]|nr:hypothetical protein [Pseudomonadales bacterium]